MRSFSSALMVLSIFVMTHSVVSVTPMSAALPASLQIESQGDSAGVPDGTEMAALGGGGVPEPFVVLLLLAGLSGLAAAGNRPSQDRESIHF